MSPAVQGSGRSQNRKLLFAAVGPTPTLPPLKLNYRIFHDTWRDLYG
ncbi:hypothetical protein T12_14878, partial [Trichinella patagoniensis]